MTTQTRPDAMTFSVPSNPACLAVVRAAVEKLAHLAGFGEQEAGRIVLAVDEACTNIIRHQYGGRYDQRFDLEMRLDPEAGILELALRDYGPERDPSLFRGRELKDVRPGGLGLHIIREVMDEVEYSAAPGGGMVLKLSKRVRSA